MKMMERWIEVDLSKLAHNFRLIRQALPAEVKLLAVVKADAYGHGLVPVGRLFAELGADYLGVTDIAEGEALRQAGVTVPILVFAPFLPEELSRLVAADLTATLSNLTQLRALAEQKLDFSAHLKLETGLGRTGFKPGEELREAITLLADQPQITVQGVYTHFATAMWSDDRYVKEQLTLFDQGVQQLAAAGYAGLIRHAANSAAMMKYPQARLDMVRAGTILYGQEGEAYQKQLGGTLEDGWSLKARVVALERLPKGHGVGYERAYITKRPTTVAIVPVGYSHGVGVEPVLRTKRLKDALKSVAKTMLRYVDHPRMRVYVTGRGKKMPILGKVAMQLLMADATDVPDLAVGDVVTVPARRTTINGTLPKVYLPAAEAGDIGQMGQEFTDI